jgi:hypothetical protein
MIDLMHPMGGRWGSRESVVRRMVESHGWKRERAERVLTNAIASDRPVELGRGGSIRYSGTDVAIYPSVVDVIHKGWEPKKGWRNARALDCHKAVTARSSGDWVYPDVVVLSDPLRRTSSTSPLEVHTIEVERRQGFSIQSIYQAYEQGRGANYRWVFFVASSANVDAWITLSKTRARDIGVDARSRIWRAASERGVGLVLMERPHVKGTWRELLTPNRMPTDDIDSNQRGLLFRAACLTPEMLEDRTRS